MDVDPVRSVKPLRSSKGFKDVDLPGGLMAKNRKGAPGQEGKNDP